MNLYQIEEEIMNCIDQETGEVVDTEALDRLEMERDTKIENIALWIKNLKADAEAIKKEKDSLGERQKAAENKAESLKKYLTAYLDGSKFSTPKVSISFLASKSVEVEDVHKIMELDDGDQYLTYKEPTVKKEAIKKALNAGINLPGCSIKEKSNIQIK